MVADAGVDLPALRVDGGMTANGLLLQIQADVLGLPVVRPAVIETAALGAAYAAGAGRRLLELAGGAARGSERGEREWAPRATGARSASAVPQPGTRPSSAPSAGSDPFLSNQPQPVAGVGSGRRSAVDGR